MSTQNNSSIGGTSTLGVVIGSLATQSAILILDKASGHLPEFGNVVGFECRNAVVGVRLEEWLWTDGGAEVLDWNLPSVPPAGTREIDTRGSPTDPWLGYWEYGAVTGVNIVSGGGSCGIEPTSSAGGTVCYTERNAFLDKHTFQEPVYS